MLPGSHTACHFTNPSSTPHVHRPAPPSSVPPPMSRNARYVTRQIPPVYKQLAPTCSAFRCPPAQLS